MFRRTYYVQRAERRNEGEAVMRDTSFSSFMCILFIFLLFTSLIIILSQWRLLFLVSDEVVDLIAPIEDTNKFGKIMAESETVETESTDAIWRVRDNTETSSEMTWTEETKTTTASVLLQSKETEATTANFEFSRATIDDWYFTPSSRETTNYDNGETRETSDTSAITSSDEETSETMSSEENTKITEYKSDATLSTSSETLESLEPEATTATTLELLQSEDTKATNDDFEFSAASTNDWYFTPSSRETSNYDESETNDTSDTSATSATTGGDETSETMSSGSNEENTKTTDWKRDATLSTSDLIDLDTTETDNFVYGLATLFRNARMFTTKAAQNLRDQQSEDTTATSVTSFTTETMESTETTELMRVNNTIRPEQPEQFYNEQSKVKKPGVDLHSSLKDKGDDEETINLNLNLNINDSDNDAQAELMMMDSSLDVDDL